MKEKDFKEQYDKVRNAMLKANGDIGELIFKTAEVRKGYAAWLEEHESNIPNNPRDEPSPIALRAIEDDASEWEEKLAKAEKAENRAKAKFNVRLAELHSLWKQAKNEDWAADYKDNVKILKSLDQYEL